MPNKTVSERQAIIDRLNPDNVPYLHTFDAKTGKCTDCGGHLLQFVYDDGDVQRINMWCSVIGLDEVSKCRNKQRPVWGLCDACEAYAYIVAYRQAGRPYPSTTEGLLNMLINTCYKRNKTRC